MNKRSSFSLVTYASPGEVRISEQVLAQPNGAIRDIAMGQWAFGQQNSVNYDLRSRHMFVDTYDMAITRATTSTLELHPAISRVSAMIGSRAVFGYIADISHVNHLLYRGVDLGLENIAIDDHRLKERRRRHGTELLVGVVFREFGELGYSGPKELEAQAENFNSQLSDFAKLTRTSSMPVNIPSMDNIFEKTRRPELGEQPSARVESDES